MSDYWGGESRSHGLIFAWGWVILIGAYSLFIVEFDRFGLAALHPSNLPVTIAYLLFPIMILVGPTLPVVIPAWRRSDSLSPKLLVAVVAIIVVLMLVRVCREPHTTVLGPAGAWSGWVPIDPNAQLQYVGGGAVTTIPIRVAGGYRDGEKLSAVGRC